jgi:hemerythrin superfamily protein
VRVQAALPDPAGFYHVEERVVGADVVDLIMSDHREVERLFEILKTRPDQRVTTLPVLSALLIAHSRAEESEVYPVARDEAGAGDEVAHSQEEHVEAEQLLEQLQATDPEAPEFEKALQQVVDAVTHHVEEEESKVLPAMRTGLQDARREELGQAFAASRAEHLGEMPGEANKEALLQQAENVGMGGVGSMSKDELKEELQKKAAQ